MKISQLSADKYQISDDSHKVVFNREKFEDLYYAVPPKEDNELLNTSYFLRLLLDNICENDEQRQMMNAMLGQASDRELLLQDLQRQIQNIEGI